METFEITYFEHSSVVVAKIKGYFNAQAGEQLNYDMDQFALRGKNNLVIDFTDCPLLNSPGVTAIVDIALKVTDDFGGKIIFVGLDTLKYTVLRTVHVIPTAKIATSVEEGIAIAQGI